MQPITFQKPKLHLFICTNDRTGVPNNTKPSCGPRISPEHVKELKRWICEQGLTTRVYCTQAKCLGFCNAEASVVCAYPEGKFFKIQSVEELKKHILEKIETKNKKSQSEQSSGVFFNLA